MSQRKQIVQTLKRELKRQGKTYRDLAAALSLSESSVKRMFALAAISLERLDQICAFLGLEISELITSMENDKRHIERLTLAQEKELVSDIRLLLIAVSLLNKLSYREILATYDISEFESTRLMAQLDRMQLIELLPGNRVKLKISRNFSWLPNGPIQRFFENSVQAEFFDCQFDAPGELQLFVSGMLSKKSNAELIARMRRLLQEFNSLHDDDLRLPLDERYGTSMVLAIRPWELQVFREMRRSGTVKTF